MQALMLWSHRHPKTIITIILLCTLFFSFGLPRIRVDSSMSGMMVQGGPDEKFYNETIEKFGSDNITVIFIKDKDLFTPQKLTLIDEIHFQMEELPAVEKVESLFSVTNFKNVDGMLDVSPLMDYVPETDTEAKQIKTDALKNNVLLNNIISPDGNSVALNLYVKHDYSDPDFVRNFTNDVKKVISEMEPEFEQIFQLGNSYTRDSINSSILSDQITLVPLSILVLLLVLLIAIRSSAAAILPMLTAGSSVLWSAGFMGYFNIPLNILTAIVPTLIIVIGSTEDIHLLSEYTEGLEKNKGIKIQALEYMVSKTGTAVMLTALTTFLGFLSITLNDIEILMQFGIVASFALFVNPIITCMIAPVYLKHFGPEFKNNDKDKKSFNEKLLSIMADKIIYLIENKKNLLLSILLAFTLFIGLFATNIRVDNDLLGYFKPDSKIRIRSQILHDEISGPQVFYIRVSAEIKNFFKEPENLKKVSDLVEYMQEKKWFDKVSSLTEYLKLINREMNNGDESFYKFPDSKELIAQYLLTLQRDEIERYVSPDYSEVNIMVRHIKGSSHELKKAVSDVEKYIKLNIDPHIHVGFTGENILVNDASDSIAYGQIKSLSLLMIIIFIIMSFLFVNVKAGLLSLIPNFFPIILIFGIMGIFNIPLNIGTAMVAAIAIGIAVDDTIHFMTRYNKEMRILQDQQKAINKCLRSEIKPVTSTSIALTMGFMVVCFSSFNPIVYFGLLSAVVMMIALIGDLFLTPILLSSTQLITIWDLVKLDLRQEVINRSALFYKLKPWQMKRVILLGKILETPKDDMAISYGDQGNTMFLVLEGTGQVLTRDSENNVCVLDKVRPGDVFGEMALVNPGPRTADIKAVEDMKCLEFDWKGMNRIRMLYPRIAVHLYRNIAKILGQRLKERTLELMKITK
jgi:uncharacterized protein